MAKPFQYKHFRIEQDNSPMKVGTDGVLIGAWTNAENKKEVLDIGTGTGLIALMLAQRYPNTNISAIELNEGAFKDATTNFKNSSWSDRIHPILSDLNNYEPKAPFDLIVSNPPFFINSQKNKEQGKTIARHTDSLSFEELINFADNNLVQNGQLDLILPQVEGDIFIQLALAKGLHLYRICKVSPKQYKKPHRFLMSFSRNNREISQEALTIELEGRHQYSLNYRALTKDFYLKF